MAFYIDKQTLDDLNVFGKRGRDSIYGMFNVARTRGGGQVLDAMFRYPLSDADAINTRSAIIGYMLDHGVEFPFAGELFDTVEYYLSNTDVRTKLAAENNTLKRKFKGAVGADAEYEQLHKGVLASIRIICTLKTFAQKMESSASDNPYRRELNETAIMAADPEFDPLYAHGGTKKLAYAKTAALDELIRFRLREKFQKILHRIYHLDVYTAVAAVAAKYGFSFSTALPGRDNSMVVEGMYHPQVKNAVPNTLRVDPAGNVLFLTGANMAGKSTFMKTLGLTVYLAHMGFPVPAKRMEFATLDGMYTTINLPDNLAIGYSHFYAEVMRVKKVAEALGKSKHLLVIFDELFRGTNVKDAYDATVAITHAFSGKRDCLFVISTHIIEAGDELRKLCDNVRFIYLPTIMEGSVAKYPYKLSEGITPDRHGMMIINNENVVDIIKQGGRKDGHKPATEFTVDKQTVEDLNMLGEFRPGSIFGLYNRTKTRGGKQMLEDMFRQPLNDASAINERVSAFSWFGSQDLPFPATSGQVNAVEQYINTGASSNIVGAYIATARRKIMHLISRDKEYGLIKAGLETAVKFIVELRSFVGRLDRRNIPQSILPIITMLDDLFADRRMGWVFVPREKTPWFTLARQDHALRSVLHERIRQMMKAVYAIDLYIAVAETANQRGFNYPHAIAYDLDNNHIHVEGFYHPAIPAAVANDISITRDQNVIFLTGANMAGKSTLMKSFSIAVYLAHMGFPVAAKNMKFTVLDGVYTSINVSDNLILGYSHFYAEVIRVKRVAEEVAAGKNLLIVFDELFKGTNVKDAFDATVAVADAFGDHPNCSYIISTHIIEAGHTLTDIKRNMQFVYMPTVMKESVPTYPYRLACGITDDRHGMIIIQNEKIIDIINRATEPPRNVL